jgi:hypothetical protein
MRMSHLGTPFVTAQDFPHAPQFCTSATGFAQPELQQFQPPGQLAPHPPQLKGSAEVSTQMALQHV